MLNRTAYPTPPDVIQLLTTMGVSSAAPGDLSARDALDDAVASWETETDYKPFLADTVDSTRPYTRASPSLHGRTLDLDGGLIAAPTSVVANGVTLRGDITNSPQYWLKPDNAVVRGKPIVAIEFLVSPVSLYLGGSFGPGENITGYVTVTGKWGYAAVLPADVWRMIQLGAAARLYLPLWTQQSNGLAALAIGAGDITTKWDRKGAFDMTVAAAWDRLAQRYRRKGIA